MSLNAGPERIATLRWARQILFEPASQEDHNIRLVFLDTLWVGVMMAGAGTFLAVFMARLGASTFAIGLLTSIPAALSMLTTLPASAFVERQRDQVRTVTLFRALYRSVYVILALAPFLAGNDLIVAILVLSGVQAALKEVQGLAHFSVISEVVPANRRPVINGLRWAVVSVVSAVAVALFGRLLDAPGLPFPSNYQVLFAVTAVIGFAALPAFAGIRVPPGALPQAAPVSLGRHLRTLLSPIRQSREFVLYLAGTAPLRLGMMLTAGLFSVYWVDTLRAQDSIIGLRETVSQAALVIGYLVFGRMAMKRSNRTVLLVSALGLSLYPAATALAPNQYWLLPIAILYGFFSTGISISFFEVLVGAAPPGKRPSFSAVNNIAGGIVAVIGPLLGALIAASLGIQVALFVAAGLQAGGALLSWSLGVGRRQPA